MTNTDHLAGLAPAVRARIAGWLACAERGWHLFPIRPGHKEPPVFRRWAQHATTDPARLITYFAAHPRHNAGIACRPSGLIVLDCDLPTRVGQTGSGAANLRQLATVRGHTVPATYTVATPSGGRHLYFRAPAGQIEAPELGNTARFLAPLLDSRGGGTGDGGYVLAPGCWLAPRPATADRIGHPGGTYELLDDSDPVPLPTWIHQALTERRSPATSAPPEPAPAAGGWSPRYVDHVVGQERQRVLRAGPGQHNTAVFTAARALGQLAAAGALDAGEAEALLTRAAAGIAAGPCDCTIRGLVASIRSGLAYGARRPRRLPTPRVEHPSRKASA